MTLVTVICGAVWLTFPGYFTDQRLTDEQRAEGVVFTIRKDDVHFLPLYLEIVSAAFAAGRLPRMNQQTMAAIKKPAWRGPKRQPPQPEKEAQSLGLLAPRGHHFPDDARDQLES